MPENHPSRRPSIVRIVPIPAFSEAQRARFWSRVDRQASDACWPWVGRINNEGYGTWKDLKAHRLAYTFQRGEIPNGLTIDHLCGNRSCVNPAHLDAVTMTENVLRGHAAKRESHYKVRKRTPERYHRRRARGVCAQCNTPSETYRCARCNQREADRKRSVYASKKNRSPRSPQPKGSDR